MRARLLLKCVLIAAAVEVPLFLRYTGIPPNIHDWEFLLLSLYHLVGILVADLMVSARRGMLTEQIAEAARLPTIFIVQYCITIGVLWVILRNRQRRIWF